MAAKKSYIITTRKEAWHHPGSRSNGTIQGVVYKRLKECTRARKCHVLARQKRHERRIPWIQSVRRVRALQRDATWPHQSVKPTGCIAFKHSNGVISELTRFRFPMTWGMTRTSLTASG